LKDDHRRARSLAETIDQCSSLSIDLDTVETNILIFDVFDQTADQAVGKLADHGVHLVKFGPKTLRATFHFQVDDEDLKKTQKAIQKNFG
jgi:threonine aldolase